MFKTTDFSSDNPAYNAKRHKFHHLVVVFNKGEGEVGLPEPLRTTPAQIPICLEPTGTVAAPAQYGAFPLQGRWHKTSLKWKGFYRTNFLHRAQPSMDILTKEVFRTKKYPQEDTDKIKREQNLLAVFAFSFKICIV